MKHEEDWLESLSNWLAGFVRLEAPGRAVECRCGRQLEAGVLTYRCIAGFYRGHANKRYLCLECGRAVLQAILETYETLLDLELYVCRLPDDHPVYPRRYEVDLVGGVSFRQGGRRIAGPFGSPQVAAQAASLLEAAARGDYEVRGGFAEWGSAPSRADSQEVDFGVRWRIRGTPHTWRVSWIADTGELYARELAPDGDRFVVLGAYPDRGAVEAAMSGWAGSSGELGRFFPMS